MVCQVRKDISGPKSASTRDAHCCCMAAVSRSLQQTEAEMKVWTRANTHAHGTFHEIRHLLVPIIRMKGCSEPYCVHHICCVSFRLRVQSLRSMGTGKILVSIIPFALTHMMCTTDSECLYQQDHHRYYKEWAIF